MMNRLTPEPQGVNVKTTTGYPTTSDLCVQRTHLSAMEYDLHRKKKVAFVLKASPYIVHDRVEFAELTKRFSEAFKEKITNPLHFDICWGSPFKLRHVTTILKVHVPSVQTLETERILERQRLEKAELQHKVALNGQTELKSKIFLERRPLPPCGFH